MAKAQEKHVAPATAEQDAKALQSVLARNITGKPGIGASSERKADHGTARPKGNGKPSSRSSESIAPPNISLPVTFGSIVANLLGLAMPLVILQVYDRIIPNQAIATFTLLILGLITALCLEAAMRTARAWLTGWSVVDYEISVAR